MISFFNLICRSHGLSYSKFTLSNLQLPEANVLGGEFKLGVSLSQKHWAHYWLGSHPGLHLSTRDFSAVSSVVTTQKICQGTQPDPGEQGTSYSGIG